MSFLRPFLLLSGLGLVGVVAGLPIIVELLRAAPELPDLPLPVLAVISLVQPGLLVLASVAVGLLLAPRLGLKSHLVVAARGGGSPWPRIGSDLLPALSLGLAVGALTALLELGFRPWLPAAVESLSGPRSLPLTLSAILYGGVTEEILTRWGLLTVVAVGLNRLSGGWREAGRPGAPVMWSAIMVTALLFGALHLPALALVVGLTPLLVVRTLLLNALAAVAFGWLFWRRSLEGAMLGHGAAHVMLALMSWSGMG